MERNIYVTVKQSFDRRTIEERRKLVDNIPILQMLSEDHKNILADALEMAMPQTMFFLIEIAFRLNSNAVTLSTKAKPVIVST